MKKRGEVLATAIKLDDVDICVLGLFKSNPMESLWAEDVALALGISFWDAMESKTRLWREGYLIRKRFDD